MSRENVDYLEERARVLGSVDEITEATGTDYAARVRDLVTLGEEIVALIEPMSGDADMQSLRGWLETDLAAQRALLSRLCADTPRLAS